MFPKPCCNEVERTRHQVRAKILRHDGSRNNYSAKSKAKREGEREVNFEDKTRLQCAGAICPEAKNCISNPLNLDENVFTPMDNDVVCVV
ncbi:hypothetical protein TNCV_1078751 [Trichonephila clavipes]|nr:hypothetical protein TNCV_1078751 [Trichonephila clavipes]